MLMFDCEIDLEESSGVAVRRTQRQLEEFGPQTQALQPKHLDSLGIFCHQIQPLNLQLLVRELPETHCTDLSERHVKGLLSGKDARADGVVDDQLSIRAFLFGVKS